MKVTSMAAVVVCVCTLFVARPARAQQVDIKAAVVKHLTVSRDFTLKVAEQMPDADYAFKLTPPQMSFGEQIAHLASDQAGILAPFTGQRPARTRPASMNKQDIITYARESFDKSIAIVSAITPEQMEKTYPAYFGPMTGLELLMFLLDHTTHHRASAEMYLRARGITPAEYQF